LAQKRLGGFFLFIGVNRLLKGHRVKKGTREPGGCVQRKEGGDEGGRSEPKGHELKEKSGVNEKKEGNMLETQEGQEEPPKARGEKKTRQGGLNVVCNSVE